jgi:arabinofuranosyltransferase
MTGSADSKRNLNRYGVGALILFFGIIVVLNAWICDDAFITLRTVDNFVNGYGLTWNVSERVQAYTHPLWMFLIAIFYFFTREPYLTVVLLSIAMSIVAVGFYAFRVAGSSRMAVVGILALTFSKSFIDYTTSGLENPLSYLLLGILVYLYCKVEDTPKKMLYFGLVTSALLLTRLDFGLIVAPVLIHQFWTARSFRALRYTIIGLLPLLFWELFSLFYYGFPLPNTAYAKLNTGIPQADLLAQGWEYVKATFGVDPLTFVVIAASLVAVVAMRQMRPIVIALGMVLYLGYIVRIGGGFMVGRFFAVPLYLAVIVLTYKPIVKNVYALTSVAVTIMLLGILAVPSPVFANFGFVIKEVKENLEFGICDERFCYYDATGLLNYSTGEPLPNHEWRYQGLEYRDNKTDVRAIYTAGMIGYFAGPEVHLIDRMALCDPFLAHIKIKPSEFWRIGHFGRRLPRGYLESIRIDSNVVQGQNYRELYDKIRLITQGPLLSKERLREVIRFNLYGVDKQEIPPREERHVHISDLGNVKSRGTPWDDPNNIQFGLAGLMIEFDELTHAARLEISKDSNDRYWVKLLKGSRLIWVGSLPPAEDVGSGLNVDTIVVSPAAVAEGFDHMRIEVAGGTKGFAIGHVRILDDSLSGD